MWCVLGALYLLPLRLPPLFLPPQGLHVLEAPLLLLLLQLPLLPLPPLLLWVKRGVVLRTAPDTQTAQPWTWGGPPPFRHLLEKNPCWAVKAGLLIRSDGKRKRLQLVFNKPTYSHTEADRVLG